MDDLPPITQATKDFRQGLTHLDACPFPPKSAKAHLWRTAMKALGRQEQESALMAAYAEGVY